jgi:Putative adhesin
MPTDTHRFPTPEPIHLRLRTSRGTVEVVAAEVAETVVHVTGRHEGVQARVEASADGRTVTIDVPRSRRLGNPPRLDITVQLPMGSTVDLTSASASVATRGVLAGAEVRTASGTVSVEQVTGDAAGASSSGDIRLGAIGGAVRLKSASGDLLVATSTKDCRASTASGAIDIGWAGHDVTAKSASGDITVRDAVRGKLDLHATSGDVSVGVRKGTLVWLDLTTVSGRTSSDLTPDEPATDDREETLAIRVRTVSGNIALTPSSSAGAGSDDRRQPA